MEYENKSQEYLVECSLNGDKEALSALVLSLQDLVFNLSLRMLGVCEDANDAAQDIMIKVITSLSTYRGDAKFSTWVYKIALNYLMDYRKSMFYQHPLSLEFYENDIRYAVVNPIEHLESSTQLSEELKLSCSNVMLQCLKPLDRSIYVLGTMFHVNSVTAAQILDMTPEVYRQRLTRCKKKMNEFLKANCGLCGGVCSCEKRVPYAIETHRLNPEYLPFSQLKALDTHVLKETTKHMEELEDKAELFQEMPHYHASDKVHDFVRDVIDSIHMEGVKKYCGDAS